MNNDPTQFGRLTKASQFYIDAQNGQLPQISWVIPDYNLSEHPPASIVTGMSYVTGLINAVMNSPSAPGLYAVNSAGFGPVAAQIANGSTYSNAFQCDASGKCSLTPISVSTSASPTYLILYGRGIRLTWANWRFNSAILRRTLYSG